MYGIPYTSQANHAVGDHSYFSTQIKNTLVSFRVKGEEKLRNKRKKYLYLEPWTIIIIQTNLRAKHFEGVVDD